MLAVPGRQILRADVAGAGIPESGMVLLSEVFSQSLAT